MSDLYTEVIVKKQKTAKDTIIKIGLGILTFLVLAVFLLGIIGLISFIPLIAVAVLDYFIWPTLDVEYEYLYVNGELDVDKIMSKKKRKRVFTCDIDKVELMAPSNSHELDYYNNNKTISRLDFSSMNPEAKTYTMVIGTEKGTQLVIFEPNETIINDMKRLKPREVKMY